MESNQDVVLDLRGVHKRYRREQVLRGLNLSVRRGEIVGLLGPNGAGKTTTLRIASGYAWPDAGEIRLNGRRLTPGDAAMRSRIGYLPERAPLYDAFRVERYLRFVATARGLRGAAVAAAVAEAIRSCHLDDVRRRVIANLSKGYRQRVGLAQALVGAPDLLLLDEPTNGLDPFQIVEARELIRAAAQGRAIIFSTHIMQEVAALCSRVVYLRQGELIELDAARPAADTLRCMRAEIRTTDLTAVCAALAAVGAPTPAIRYQRGDDVGLTIMTTDRTRGAYAHALATTAELRQFAPETPELEQRLAAAIAADASP